MATAGKNLSVFFNSKLKVQQIAKLHFEKIGNTCYYIQLINFNEKTYIGLCKATTNEENQAQSIRSINIPSEFWWDCVKAIKRMSGTFSPECKGIPIYRFY